MIEVTDTVTICGIEYPCKYIASNNGDELISVYVLDTAPTANPERPAKWIDVDAMVCFFEQPLLDHFANLDLAHADFEGKVKHV